MADLTRARLPIWAAYGYAILLALVIGHFLLGIPIQLSDSFGNMLKLSMPWDDLLRNEFTQEAYLRPMLWAQLKLVYELSGGSYFAWFRGTHVVQVLLLVLMFLALVRPRTWLDAASIPFGLAVLVSMHTFTGTIREAFPINTYMTMLLFCYGAALIALASYRWWNDVLAVALFALAALTFEAGLLVWVIFIGAALIGARGVSRAGLAALVVAFAGYFYARFVLFDVGAPDLLERSSGFGFTMLDPSDLQERFGSNPLGFYAYNVITSALSVMFSEPTAGVFRVTSALLRGDLTPSVVMTVIASTSVTVLVAAFAWRRRHAWLSRRFDRDDRLVLLFIMVLAANAVISYPYTKDVIMSPAGAFLAVAACVALRSQVAALPSRLSPAASTALVAAFAVVGTTWASQFISTHLALRNAAYAERTEWAYAENSLRAEGVILTESEQALMRTLRDDAVFRRTPPPPLRLPMASLFGSN